MCVVKETETTEVSADNHSVDSEDGKSAFQRFVEEFSKDLDDDDL